MSILRYRFGSAEWDAMQEREVIKGFAQAAWPEDVRFSLVERYAGATPRDDGSIYGFRVDVAGSKATFRRGVAPGETGDVTVDMRIEALQELIHVSSMDPAYPMLVERLVQAGAIRLHGEFAPLAAVSRQVHHQVFLHTL